MVRHQPLITRVILNPVFEATSNNRRKACGGEEYKRQGERELGKTSRQTGVPLLLSGKKLAQVFADACKAEREQSERRI